MCKGGGQNTVTSQSAPPPDVLKNYNNVNAIANQVAKQPYQYYPGQLVAGLSPDQQQAIATVANAQGIATPFINASSQLTTSAAQPLSAGDINSYLNPYLSDVANTTSQVINQNNAQQQNQLLGNAAALGALGGNRVGIAQSALAGQQDLAENATLANIYGQGYNTALGAAQTTKGQQLQGGFMLGQLGQEAQNAALTGANAQFQLGSAEQQQQQNQLNAVYSQWLGAQQYPFQTTQFLNGIATGTGSLSGGQSSTTQPSPSTLSQVAGALTGGVGLLGATGAFGSAGWLTGLLGLKQGGRAEYAEGGATPYNGGETPYPAMPDGAVKSYVPMMQPQVLGHGPPGGGVGGPPQAPQPQQQDNGPTLAATEQTFRNAFGQHMASAPPTVDPTMQPVQGGLYARGGRTGFASGGASAASLASLPLMTPTPEQTIEDYDMISRLAPGAQVQHIQYQAPRGAYASGGGAYPAVPYVGSGPPSIAPTLGNLPTAGMTMNAVPAAPMVAMGNNAVQGARTGAQFAPLTGMDWLTQALANQHAAAPAPAPAPAAAPAGSFTYMSPSYGPMQLTPGVANAQAGYDGVGFFGGGVNNLPTDPGNPDTQVVYGNNNKRGGRIGFADGGAPWSLGDASIPVKADVPVDPMGAPITQDASGVDSVTVKPAVPAPAAAPPDASLGSLAGPASGVAPVAQPAPAIPTVPPPSQAASGPENTPAPQPPADPLNGYAQRVLSAESGGNPNARPVDASGKPLSSAYGPGQFTTDTWLRLAQGQPWAQGKTPDQVLALRSDPTISAKMTEAYAKQNAPVLAAAGVPVTWTSLDLAHRFGAQGAVAIAKAYATNPNAPVDVAVGQQAIAANPSLAGKTVADVVGQSYSAMTGKPVPKQYAQADTVASDATAGPGSNIPLIGGMSLGDVRDALGPTPQIPQAKETGLEKMANSPWMALAQAGFGMMAGTSPFAGVNIGRGLLAGTDYLNHAQEQQRAVQALQANTGAQQARTDIAARQQALSGFNNIGQTYTHAAAVAPDIASKNLNNALTASLLGQDPNKYTVPMPVGVGSGTAPTFNAQPQPAAAAPAPTAAPQGAAAATPTSQQSGIQQPLLPPMSMGGITLPAQSPEDRYQELSKYAGLGGIPGAMARAQMKLIDSTVAPTRTAEAAEWSGIANNQPSVQTSLTQLHELADAVAKAPANSFQSTLTSLMSKVQGIAQIAGLPVDQKITNYTQAADLIKKINTQLSGNIAKSWGERAAVALNTIQRAVPSGDLSSPQSFKQIVRSIGQQVQFANDLYTYGAQHRAAWQSAHPFDPYGWENEFLTTHPPEMYASRVTPPPIPLHNGAYNPAELRVGMAYNVNGAIRVWNGQQLMLTNSLGTPIPPNSEKASP